MANSFFKFKQFIVNQDRCAMKVGTDGVVLGATATFPDQSLHLADVGTGTGLVSLMVKQRYPNANITAIEIDPDAAAQAQENFDDSPWQIKAVCASWQEFASSATEKFDGIFCNPPYFTASLKNPSASRTLARHNDSLSFNDLIKGAAKILVPGGLFYVILPSADMDAFTRLCSINGLNLKEVLYVHPVIEGPHKRVVLCFTNCTEVASSKAEEKKAEEKHLYIETTTRKVYTPEFKLLTQDFYL